VLEWLVVGAVSSLKQQASSSEWCRPVCSSFWLHEILIPRARLELLPIDQRKSFE
jgi:hypothetical protein